MPEPSLASAWDDSQTSSNFDKFRHRRPKCGAANRSRIRRHGGRGCGSDSDDSPPAFTNVANSQWEVDCTDNAVQRGPYGFPHCAYGPNWTLERTVDLCLGGKAATRHFGNVIGEDSRGPSQSSSSQGRRRRLAARQPGLCSQSPTRTAT